MTPWRRTLDATDDQLAVLLRLLIAHNVGLEQTGKRPYSHLEYQLRNLLSDGIERVTTDDELMRNY